LAPFPLTGNRELGFGDSELNMTTLPEMRDLAQRLLSYEADADNVSESVDFATLRVYQKLRQSLGELAGSASFYALASRALTLARSEVPSLNAVQVGRDGNLEGLSAIEPSIKVEQDQVDEGRVILISRLLGLFSIFLGDALTLSLLRGAWPAVALDDRNSGNGRKS
jgi:hypothetical protein